VRVSIARSLAVRCDGRFGRHSEMLLQKIFQLTQDNWYVGNMYRRGCVPLTYWEISTGLYGIALQDTVSLPRTSENLSSDFRNCVFVCARS
jgi:hypothetical protein